MRTKSEEIFEKYEKLFDDLLVIVNSSEQRVLADTPDEIFSNNVNFFVKSYMINICTYLEAYLQDLAYEHAKEINQKIKLAKIPHNFIYWNVSRDPKEKDFEFRCADYPLEKKEISDGISANPYKTVKAYKILGIDLSTADGFKENKDLISTVVNKRNNIIHHNDSAMDISFSDLSSNIKIFKIYMAAIRDTVLGAS